MSKTLQDRGLLAVDSQGAIFDTEFHEAITEFPAMEESQKGKVIDTAEKGYTLNGKIIRYAKVVVGK
jgi:molecular chaperone GrpE